jgi:hypothetical protein
MAQQQKLADLIIEFTLKGVEALRTALTTIRAQFAAVAEGAQRMARITTIAFAALSAPVLGFIRQGMQLSYMGDLLRMQFERLALAIAGLFRPEIEAVIGFVRGLAERMEGLSNSQREAIAHWVKMVSVFALVATGIKLMSAAMTVFNIATGGILPLIGLVVTALTGIGIASKAGEEGTGGLGEMFSKLVQTLKPVWDALQPVIRAVTQLARHFVEAMAPVLERITKALAKLLEDGGPALSGLIVLADKMLESFTFVLEVLTKIAASLENMGSAINILAPGLAAIGELFGSGGKSGGGGFASKLDELRKNRTAAPRKSPGFEALEQTYMRLAAASVNIGSGKVAGKPPEEEALDWLRKIVENTGPIADLLRNQKGAFAG